MEKTMWHLVDEKVRGGRVTEAIEALESHVRESGVKEFQPLLGLNFSNKPSDVLSTFNAFLKECSEAFSPKAMYVEMNGFDINYDQWYFDLFAYSAYPESEEDNEWLCDWQSPNSNEVILSGAEDAQGVFAWYHENRVWKSRPELKPTYDAAMLLVTCNFMKFVGSALEVGELKPKIPVLATAHGFESIVRFVR